MAVSNITVKGLTPNLLILGNYQRFTFEDPVSAFQKDTTFAPTLGVPTQTNDEHRNSTLSGFRWYHTTAFGDTIGTYTLQSFVNAAPIGTDLMRVNQNNTIDFLVPTSLSGFSITEDLDMDGFKVINLGAPTNPNDAVNKAYADALSAGAITLTGAVTGNGTGTINTVLTPFSASFITDFNSSVLAFRLDQFAAPISSLDLANEKIINLLTPTLASDAATKGYVDNKTWTTSVITDFNTAVIAYRLDQFAAPNTSISMDSQKIINLLTPTLNTDAATKGYVDSAISAGSLITLTGAVTGSGTGTIATVLTDITTSQISNFNASVLAYRLDQFAAPNTSVSMGSQKITNLLTPTLASDASTKGYVDAKTWTTSQITDYVTATTAFRLDQFAAPNTSVSMGSQKIINLLTPTLATDAATKAYVDSFAGASLTLTGAVTGSGTGTIATTLTNITTSQITNFNAAVTAFRLDQFATPITSVDMGSRKIINLLTPTLAADATTKDYVDINVTNATVIATNNASNFTLKYQRSANVYSVNNAVTNVLVANTPQKIAGFTNSLTAGFTTSGSNRVVYSGPESLFFTVYGSAQVSSSAGGGTILNLEIVKNGTVGIILPIISTRVLSANTPQIITIHSTPFQMVTNDYVELFITASVNTTVTVSNMCYTLQTIAF